MTILLDNINSALAKAIECLARDPKRAERLLADVKRWVGELAAAQASAAPVAAQKADDARDALRRLVDEKFSSGNAIPVERITITRQEYAAIAQQRGGDVRQVLRSLHRELALIESDPDSDLSDGARRTLNWARCSIDAALAATKGESNE